MKFLFLLGLGFDEQTPSTHLMLSIIRACLKEGDSVHAIVSGHQNREQIVPDDILKTNKFTYDVVYINDVKKTNFVLRFLKDIRYTKKCNNKYKKIRDIDAIFLQSNNVSYFHNKRLKKTIGAPIVYNVQDIFPNNIYELKKGDMNRFVYHKLLSLQLKGYKLSTAIVTISDDMKKTLCDSGVPNEKIKVIYNWSYNDKDIPQSLNDKSPYYEEFRKHRFNVVYAGNIGVVQNVGIILEASSLLQNYEDIHFFIIGNGSRKESFLNKYANNKNVTFLLPQPMANAESVYASADLLVIPLASGIIKTALPSKTATCLRTLVPAIFCIDNDSCFANLVSKESGVYLCDPNNPKQLADLIIKNAQNPIKIEHRAVVANLMSATDNPKRYYEILKKAAIEYKK